MFRKLGLHNLGIHKVVLPAACAALLGGCVSYGYNDGYRDSGYYYGQPSTSYYGSASYGYPYGRSYGSRYGYGYGGPYGYYGGGYYGNYPGYPYYPRRPRDDHDRDHDDHDRPPVRRPVLTGDNGGYVRDALRRQGQPPVAQRPVPSRTPTLRDRYQPRPLQRADVQQRPAMQRATQPRPMMERAPQPRRESAPAVRNIRERDTRREQEP